MEFHPITLRDREWIESILRISDYRSEEYSFTFLYIWSKAFNFNVAKMDDYLIVRAEIPGRPPSYLYPAGKGDIKKVINELSRDASENGHGLLFHTVLAGQAKQLEEIYGDEIQAIQISDYWDYIYSAESLMTLSGKKLHAKRNHIHRFEAENPDWQYEPITEQNISEVVEMNDRWTKEHDGDHSRTFAQEIRSVQGAIDEFFELKLDGGLIRAGGQVVAFSIGDRLNSDTYLVHIEKADNSIQGAYAMINREFVRHNCQDFTYVNREDDSGQEGLRKAKRSYGPVMMAEKYMVRFG